MGVHRNQWAVETITKIRQIGENLGYIAAQEELRITRGYIDVCWKWKIPQLKAFSFLAPLFLLIAEIETSKTDWPRIRSNASKAIPLKPLIYAHIFHPSIKLTTEERSQLEEIHHGRHSLIIDGNSDFKAFFNNLTQYNQDFAEKELSQKYPEDELEFVMELEDGTTTELPGFLPLLRNSVPMIQIDVGEYHVGACISTIHNATWLPLDYAKIAGIDIAKEGKPVGRESILFGSTIHKAFCIDTDKIGFQGRKVQHQIVVIDTPDVFPPIVGWDFFEKIGARWYMFPRRLIWKNRSLPL